MALQLTVVTPERRVLESEADEIELPGALGYLGILPGHAPLITLLGTGVLTVRKGGGSTALAVSSGLAEVSALLGRMPSAVGYQPNLATEMGELQERITSTK